MWLNPGDCVSFSGELRLQWTHGVWRYWTSGQDPDAALSAEKPLDARLVLVLRHGEVTPKEQHEWYQYWWQDFPMDMMSVKNLKVLDQLQKLFGKFDMRASSDAVASEEELQAVKEGKEWGPFLGSTKIWKPATLTNVWHELVVEVRKVFITMIYHILDRERELKRGRYIDMLSMHFL